MLTKIRGMIMSEAAIAKRINEAITKNGGYQKISEMTGISVSTLVRAAKGKTEPKLRDVMLISSATGVPLSQIAYGEEDGSPIEKSMVEIIKGLATMNDAIFSEKIAELEKKIEELKE
ncbi:helix-turn-helix domain-containing protein [Vibrio anguillarum]|uniref:helix-turn-helix domain-containing protein n=1 Tax=Vibrio anguillarum TaxID=55601 RepID=UPI0003795F2B|nr:helix-turn-helix transcriptional regulator [Vibrio anguillarum]